MEDEALGRLLPEHAQLGAAASGHEYTGPDPDAFAPLHEVVAYLEEYARAIPAPVRTGVRVTALRQEQDGYRVETDGDYLRAANVIVATGAYQRSTPAELAAAAPPRLLQLHERVPEPRGTRPRRGVDGWPVAGRSYSDAS